MFRPKVRVERDLQCPVFDCDGNVDFICASKSSQKRRDETMGMHSVSGFVVPSCKIEGCPRTATSRCFTIDRAGVYYSFLSYVPGQGLFSGLHEGRDTEIYAIRFNGGSQIKNVDFYYDKVLKWIPKNQLLLPGFSFERIEING